MTSTTSARCNRQQNPNFTKAEGDLEPRATAVGADAESSDEELVALAREGDMEAFAKLTCRHFAICLKRATLILRNYSDAEDQVQTAFAKAFERLGQFRFQGPFSAWLYRIVQNQCLMLIRERRQAEILHVDLKWNSQLTLELIDQKRDQEDDMGSQQVLDLLRREISRVPPLLRNVIMLRDVEGLPMPEVAARLGISAPATKSRLMRARKELRERISKYCGRTGVRTLMPKRAHNKAEYMYVV